MIVWHFWLGRGAGSGELRFYLASTAKAKFMQAEIIHIFYP